MKHSWKRRRLTLWLSILLLGGAVWLGVYAWDQGFTRKWRGLIAKELAKHGLRAEIGRLTLDPVEGLTARDVKLYDMVHRNQHLADIDRISLDVDVARLVNQEDFLRTLHLQKADVSLPVDPGDPSSEWLTVEDLNARLIFQKDRIEIARAEGVVSGILVKASGVVKKMAGTKAAIGEKDRLKEERTRQLREMRDRRGALRSVLRIMDRFSIPRNGEVPERPHKAELTLEVQGDLSDIDRMEIRAGLVGGALVHQGGRVDGFEASGRLSAGVLTLQKLEVKDRHGVLHAAASWPIRQAPAVELTADCTIDLQALLRSALDDAPWLGEVVCYKPPDLRWDGRWLTAPAAGQWPLEGQGSIAAGRFLTRGVVFDGLTAKLALKPGRMIYVRQALLTHHTGEVKGQVMLGPEGGRYELDWRMAAGPAAPFLPAGGVRELLERFDFDNASRIAIRMQGDRAAGADRWRHAGKVQLRDFSYQDTPLREVAAEVVANEALESPLIFRNAVLEMKDGVGRAREVRVDPAGMLLWITGGEGTLMPAPLLHLFLPPLGRELAKYRFAKAPESRMEGVIDLKGLTRSDYRILLRARSRCGLDVGGQALEFEQTSGTVTVKGAELKVQLTGATVPGTGAFGVLSFEEAVPAAFTGTFPLLPGAAPAWQVEVRTPGRVSLAVLGRTWPLEQFAGSMKAAEDKITGSGGAQLFGGKFGASLEFPQAGSIAHEGSMVLENVPFGRLAAVLDPGLSTEGMLTGSFSWQFPPSGMGTITGKGEAKLVEGNIFALPLLGPLSTVLKAILPGENIGYSVARTATSSFAVKDGKVMLSDFEAATNAFRLMVSGEVDYLQDKVDFLARVNLRGAPGMLLFPVSKLFEYQADGTMTDPAWHSRFFVSPFRSRGDKEPENEKEAVPVNEPPANGTPRPVRPPSNR